MSFLVLFSSFFFLTFLGISSESKCPLLSRTRGTAKRYIFEKPGTKNRFCCSIKHKLHSTNPDLSPSVAPCFSCFQTCKHRLDVFCAPLPSIVQEKKKKKKPRGTKVHLTIEQREGTGWEMLASHFGQMRSQKRSIVQSALSGWEWSKKVVQD